MLFLFFPVKCNLNSFILMPVEMSRISIGHSHPAPYLGKRTLRRRRNNEETDNVVLIDLDSENYDNVVIIDIDITESLPKENQELHILKEDEKRPFRNIINIDDDETADSSLPFGVKNANFCAGTSLSRESFHVARNFGDSSDVKCKFVHDSSPPFRLSKCKRTYSGKASTRNHYGLDTDSECDLSDDDYTDCDLVEDISGDVQAMWEKTFSRRKKGIHNVYSCSLDHHCTTSCINEDHRNVESRSSFEAEVNHHKAFLGDSHRVVQDKATGTVDNRENWKCRSHITGGDKEMECSRNVRCSFSSSSLPGKETGPNSTSSCKVVDPSKSFLSLENGKKSNHKENNSLVPETNKSKHQGDDSPSNIDAFTISDREWLKETDEYKKAIEEEWASRRQALQIQAEEAQNQRRLRKRIKADSMRLLDMERRQKERLEEVRGIQKKDAENLNLKDTIRAKVRIELGDLEVRCSNMASLLHLLGIRVDNWPNPSEQEVQAAYKRALLAFHPDRTLRSDIHQLVEAEEKFKLINCMKEKFPSML